MLSYVVTGTDYVVRVMKKSQYDCNFNKLIPRKELSYRNGSKSCEVVLLLWIALWYTYLVHEDREHVLYIVGISVYIG